MHDRLNPLQSLIAEHVAQTGETYQDIAARGGMPRQTVSALMNRPAAYQSMPHADTLRRLAKGLRLPRAVVQAAAASSVQNERPEPTPSAVLLAQLVDALNENDVAVLLATARALVANAQTRSA